VIVLALLLALGPALAAPVDVRGDTVEVKEGIAVATGNVVLELGEERATAERATLTIATGQLHLENGSWERGEGMLAFREAEVDLGDLTGVVLEARFTSGRSMLRADRIELEGADAFVAERVTYTTCDCPNPTWEISARRVRVRLDRSATFVGGIVRVCGVPLVPIPFGRLALVDRKSGFLVPRLGTGEDGFLVAAPFYLTLGPSADATIAPELRTKRGLRGLGELRWALAPEEGGILSGFSGYDEIEDRWRSAVGAEHGWAPRPLRTAVRGQWVSDTDVLADYSDSYLGRSAPWTEVLATVGVGPFRLETDTFQHWETYQVAITPEETKEYTQALPVLERPLGAVLSFPGIALAGPITASVLARTDVFQDGFGIDRLVGPARARFEGDGEISGGREVGPFRLVGALRGSAIQYQADDPLEESDPWATGTAAASAILSAWGEHGALRHLLDVGMAGSLGTTAGDPIERVPWDTPPPDTVLGPAIDSTWLSAGGVPLHVRAALPWVDGEMEPTGTVRFSLGAWRSTITADRHLQEGDVGRADGIGRFDVGLARTETLLQARGAFDRRVPGLSWLRVGYAGLYDVDEDQLLWHGPTLRYVSPCACLQAGASAVWSIDQSTPQVRFQLELL
jgi:lipopolysaccharide export system protein LptA